MVTHRTLNSFPDAESRQAALMLYTMLLIAGNRKKRQQIIASGIAAGLERDRIDLDLKRYGFDHA